ncbi:hypothetical protein DVH24_038896 [Malus domestica]|uniref:Uncharacterized protein n=1 Tax=Malus domestica TaxID=3750 RepID=A0A498KG95_MALDO|nr:hypothetical protein DVH24_038896 [Malus domestica]
MPHLRSPCPPPPSSSNARIPSSPLFWCDFCFVLVLISIWESRVSDGRFMEVAEPANFVHIYSIEADYKVRQEIDFFREISGVSMSPNDEFLYIGIWD